MTTPTPDPVELEPVEGHVKPDPRRPYKALAAALAAGIVVLLDAGLPMPQWLTVTLLVAGAGAAAFVTPNPQVDVLERKRKRQAKRGAKRRRRRHPGEF